MGENNAISADAEISPDAWVQGSTIGQQACVRLRASVIDSYVADHARVSGFARVWGESTIVRHALIMGRASVDRSFITDYATVEGEARLFDAQLRGQAFVSDNAQITRVIADGECRIYGNARVGNPQRTIYLPHAAVIRGEGEVLHKSHVMCFQTDSERYTLHRTVGGGAQLNVGCQSLILKNGKFPPQEELESLAYEQNWALPEWYPYMIRTLEEIARTWR